MSRHADDVRREIDQTQAELGANLEVGKDVAGELKGSARARAERVKSRATGEVKRRPTAATQRVRGASRRAAKSLKATASSVPRGRR